ncbi:MAG TPA: hypothetical protein VET66_11275 [Steroidobacteraceae bacterium]|nr:hypothetical protein [Candidatus Dormibacteraeota bacterium]HYM28723.1 hypothetical protein [Steroidobacteraceae bacterium]
MTVELHKAIRLRDHAEELRMIAEKTNAATRRALLKVAEDYERLATALEDFSHGRPDPNKRAAS